MFVCVLLGAGLLALEREEHVFGRLVRGLVSRWAIVAEKTGLAAALGAVAAVLTLGVLVATGSDVSAGHLLAALGLIALGGVAFGALGVLLGAAARDVRTASLLGVLVLLPVAVIGLIPVGLASTGLYDAIRAVSRYSRSAPRSTASTRRCVATGSPSGSAPGGARRGLRGAGARGAAAVCLAARPGRGGAVRGRGVCVQSRGHAVGVGAARIGRLPNRPCGA